MTRIRIAHVINSAGLGGVPEAAYQLLRVLPAERYDLRLFVLRSLRGDDAARAERMQRYTALGVPVHFAHEQARGPDQIADLAAWLREERINILHTHSYRPNRLARIAGTLGRLAGLRVVAHYHNQYDDKWSRGDALAVERMLVRHTDAMVACSTSVRDHIAERVGLPARCITVVHNGVELERFRAVSTRRAARALLGLPLDATLVGLVGRLCTQKGQEDLLRAAPMILSKHPHVHFILAGEADDPATATRLHALVEQSGLTSRVHFAGFVQDIAHLYAALDLVVAPSRWEGFGLMLAEAMAAGRPIVATRAGAIPEVVVEGQTALLAEPGNPSDLARTVIALLDQPALMDSFSQHGPQRASQFSWEQAGQRLDMLYQRLVACV